VGSKQARRTQSQGCTCHAQLTLAAYFTAVAIYRQAVWDGQVQVGCQVYLWRESAMIRTRRTHVYCSAITGGPDSSVGTAARYVLDGAWINSR